MARSRKSPPLFEVMRETDRKDEAVRPGAGPPGGVLPRPAEPASRPEPEPKVFRLPTPTAVQPPRSEPTRVMPDEDAHSTRSDSPRVFGVAMSPPVMLISLGILIGVIALIATIAFRAGADRERRALLPKDGTPSEVTNPQKRAPATPDPTNAKETGSSPPRKESASNERPATSPERPAVFGDDPREKGKNYLIVETMLLKDAQAAAQFLTENGVESVVVAPEGTSPQELETNPRGLWKVIVREGFTREELKASRVKADAIQTKVKQLGRRWKQDHKGTSDFASCLWDKFGK